MYRNKTVREMQRDHQKQTTAMTQMIEKLLDRIMFLADRPWAPPPIDTPAQPEFEPLLSLDDLEY